MNGLIRQPSLADRPLLRRDWAESFAEVGAVAILSKSCMAIPMHEDLAGAKPIGRAARRRYGKVLADAELALLLADVRRLMNTGRARADCA